MKKLITLIFFTFSLTINSTIIFRDNFSNDEILEQIQKIESEIDFDHELSIDIETNHNNEIKPIPSIKRIYIVNEDGTITFLKYRKKLFIIKTDGSVTELNSPKRDYIVNEDGTVTFLN